MFLYGISSFNEGYTVGKSYTLLHTSFYCKNSIYISPDYSHPMLRYRTDLTLLRIERTIVNIFRNMQKIVDMLTESFQSTP